MKPTMTSEEIWSEMEYSGGKSSYHGAEWHPASLSILKTDEVMEALAFLRHLKGHPEVKDAPLHPGKPICKICRKTSEMILEESGELNSEAILKSELREKISQMIRDIEMEEGMGDPVSSHYIDGYTHALDGLKRSLGLEDEGR